MPYFKAEIGRKMRFDLGIDLTGNSEILITVVKPDATTYTKKRVASTDITVDDTATGQVSYETGGSDHNQVGTYRAQAKVSGVPNSGDEIWSPFILFEVENTQ